MAKKKNIFKRFPTTFWIANTMELFERWAWYGMFLVLALYLTNSKDTGALGLSQIQKGNIMGIVSAILYFLPVITGTIADKFGYKKILLISFGILSSGYFMIGYFTSYTSIFAILLYIAVGGALFKPVISATIAKTTNKTTSSIGFGIFYMMVNLGAFIGPIFASKLRELDWNYVFHMSSGIILVNVILVIFFYKEPERERNNDPIFASIKQALKNIWIALSDKKFILFLFLIIGFWSMYLQLFFTLPVFIEQWMDTSSVYNLLDSISPALASAIGTDRGTINPEMITNIDALYIVLFQILISSIVMRFKPLVAMTVGIFISATGIGLMFATNNPLFLIPSILVFAIGEMSTSPKITEYIGHIAPKNKIALYMGCSFLPMSGGNFLAGILSGSVYGTLSDKITLLKNEVATRGLKIPEISDSFTKNDYVLEAANQMNMSQPELTDFLWQHHQPYQIWYVFTAIGIFTGFALLLYNRFLISKS
ncbi:MAG: MFS transporter [Bacteroidota bacterium]|nr:MFS transporter [Bacteroidota bacterium]